MVTMFSKSADGKYATLHAIVLDEVTPPGIAAFSGYIINTDNKIGYNIQQAPITVLNRFTGEIVFTIPISWFNNNKTVAVVTGPGYTNIKFPVCEFENLN